NVIICRFAVQQEIAHTPAHQVSLVAVIAESANDVGGELLHRLSLPRTSVARAPSPAKSLALDFSPPHKWLEGLNCSKVRPSQTRTGAGVILNGEPWRARAPAPHIFLINLCPSTQPICASTVIVGGFRTFKRTMLIYSSLSALERVECCRQTLA